MRAQAEVDEVWVEGAMIFCAIDERDIFAARIGANDFSGGGPFVEQGRRSVKLARRIGARIKRPASGLAFHAEDQTRTGFNVGFAGKNEKDGGSIFHGATEAKPEAQGNLANPT